MYKEHNEFKVAGFPGTLAVGVKIREESTVPGTLFQLKQMVDGGNISEVCIIKGVCGLGV